MRRDWSAARAKVDEEGCCRNCPTTWPLETAHVIGRARDRRENGKAVVDRDSVIPLCTECHKDYDEGTLDILPLLTPVEQARAVVDAGGLITALRRVTNERNT